MGSVFPDRCWGWVRVGVGEGHPTPQPTQKHKLASNTAPIHKAVAVPVRLLEPVGDLRPMSLPPQLH